MTPIEQAKAVYAKEPCKRTFAQDLASYQAHGLVISTPEFFLMARPVNASALISMITDARVRFPEDSCNCWHVHLMAGDIAKGWSAMPYELPLFSFERQNVLRVYRTDRIRRLCSEANA